MIWRARLLAASTRITAVKGHFGLYREEIAKATGLDKDAVLLACTHTHGHGGRDSAVNGSKPDRSPRTATRCRSAGNFLGTALCGRSQIALTDPACCETRDRSVRLRTPSGGYRMKDGKVRTNPGRGNPDIAGPIGSPDEEVQLIRIDREGRDAIALVNFQCHPDTIGGTKISADWPRVVRDTFERAIDGVKCVLITGAQGDNLNQYLYSTRTTATARQSSSTGTWVVLLPHAAASGIRLCRPESRRHSAVGFGIAMARVATNRAKPEELAEAHRLMNLFISEQKIRDTPWQDGAVSQTSRKRGGWSRLRRTDVFEFPLPAVTVGDAIAFVGFPGELFTRRRRGKEGFSLQDDGSRLHR